MPAKGVTVYLPADLEAELLKAAKTKHLSASGLIAEAVKNHFKAHPNGVPEGATRQLARVEARMDKLMRDNAILKETLLLFVRIWLEYTPPLAADEEDDAAALAEQRFERFLDLVRNGGPGAGV
ncbi:MAG: hypothetical protein ACOYJ6_03705 [Caulobacterales bacterium]